MMKSILNFFVITLFLLGAGCTTQPVIPLLPSTPPEAGVESGDSTDGSYYVTFTKAEYEQARADGRPILLYFYASWCPICRDEEPQVKADVETSDAPIAGFRVHFNDPETDADAKELAKMFNVLYQHTTIILDTNGTEVERFFGPVDSEKRIAAIKEAAGAR